MSNSGLLFSESRGFSPLGRIFSHCFPVALFTSTISQKVLGGALESHLEASFISQDVIPLSLGPWLTGLGRAGWLKESQTGQAWRERLRAEVRRVVGTQRGGGRGTQETLHGWNQTDCILDWLWVMRDRKK